MNCRFVHLILEMNSGKKKSFHCSELGLHKVAPFLLNGSCHERALQKVHFTKENSLRINVLCFYLWFPVKDGWYK